MKIAIFASGNGSNAENIIRYFLNKNKDISVPLVVCNRKEAGVYKRAERLGVNALYVPKREINNPTYMNELLDAYQIDFIVLAGFMLMVPSFLLERYPNKIINIHPSLLPKFGGKGMYGHFVHEAVVEAREKETGITIHYVNEECDGGEIIFQAKTDVVEGDTPEDVETKIHALEREFFPCIVEKIVSGASVE